MDAAPIDIERAEKLFHILSEVVDHPIYGESERANLSATLSGTSLELALSVRTLCASDQLIGACICLRSQFEALLRSVWALHLATQRQVDTLGAIDFSIENRQSAKKIPMVSEMLEQLGEIPTLSQLTLALNEFKESSWQPLNSFVHAGLHAVIHTHVGWPPSLLDQCFRASNGLAILAFTNLGILTGTPGIQADIRASSACFSSILPKYRNETR